MPPVSSNSRAFSNNLKLSSLFPLGLNPRGNNSLKHLLLTASTKWWSLRLFQIFQMCKPDKVLNGVGPELMLKPGSASRQPGAVPYGQAVARQSWELGSADLALPRPCRSHSGQWKTARGAGTQFRLLNNMASLPSLLYHEKRSDATVGTQCGSLTKHLRRSLCPSTDLAPWFGELRQDSIPLKTLSRSEEQPIFSLKFQKAFRNSFGKLCFPILK